MSKEINIEKLLEAKSSGIDMEIEKLFPRKMGGKWLDFALGKALYKYDAGTIHKTISEPLWEFLDRGGKRWRPSLMLLCCEAVGGNANKIKEFVVFPELIHNSCVTGDTQIWMANGEIKDICEVNVGDKVLSLLPYGQIIEKTVVAKHKNGQKPVLLIRLRNRQIKTTRNHPFLTVSKKQATKAKITESGKKLLIERLAYENKTISKFCDEIFGELEILKIEKKSLSRRHLKHSLYGYKNCLVPYNVAKEISSWLNLNVNDLFEEIATNSEKAPVEFKWKYAEELKVDEIIAIAKDVYEGGIIPKLPLVEKHYKDRFSIPKEITADFVQICGLLIGDGYIDEGRVVFCLPEGDEARSAYAKLIEKVFGAKPGLYEQSVTCCSKALATLFAHFKIKQPCLDTQIPEWVFKLPREYKLAFVKGYIDSDGCVTKDGIVNFDCGSRVLMVQLKSLLDSMGFVTSNIDQRIIDNSHFGEKMKKEKTILYGVSLYSRNKVMEEIGTEKVTYKNRLMQLAKRRIQFRLEEFVPSLPINFDGKKIGFARVRKIEEVGQEDTYDIEVEDTHNYISNGIITHNTLVEDDFEDRSELRRGKPCTYKLYGEDIAINLGSMMYMLPFVMLYKNTKKLPEKKRNAIYDMVTQELLRVHIGQATDIGWHRGMRENISEEEYLQMCINKTGCLSRLSCRLGALLGNGTKKQIEALGNFGASIGVAFQIQDDILNLVGEEFAKGKGLGEDIHEGKRTLLVLRVLKKANDADGKRLIEILNAHPGDMGTINEAIGIIKKYGAIEYGKEKARKIVEKSWKEVDKALKKSEAKETLRAFADYLINRKI